MDYFLLDKYTGELRTAKPLDREALIDTAGIIKLTVRVCILNTFPYCKISYTVECSTKMLTIL